MNPKKTGILLLNFGGPNHLQEVKPFLYRLFSDPAVLVGIPSPFRQFIAYFISQVKGASSIRAYDAIGGASPLVHWTRIQAQGLQSLLDSSQCLVALGMRLSEPSIEKGLFELRQWGASELVLLPLFPQYSTTTTGTCIEEVKRCLSRMCWVPDQVREIYRWPDQENYIRLMKEYLQETLNRVMNSNLKKMNSHAHILFSAHSLPMKIVERGDPYPDDVQKTVKALTQNLDYSWSLAYQSRNGRMAWLSPYVEEEIPRLAQQGVRNLVVCPMSFVSDHIETLWELDRFYAELARKRGIVEYHRVRTFNDDPKFWKVLKAVVKK